MLLLRNAELPPLPFVLCRCGDGEPVGAWPTGGDVALAWGSGTSAPVSFDATAGGLAAALAPLVEGVVVGTQGPWPALPVVVEFTGDAGGRPQPLIAVAEARLSGGLAPRVAITRVQSGSTDWTNRQDTLTGAAGAAGGTFDLSITQAGSVYQVASVPYDAAPSGLAGAIAAVCGPVVEADGGTLRLGEVVRLDWVGAWAGSAAPTAVELASQVDDGTYTVAQSRWPESRVLNEIQQLAIEHGWPRGVAVIDGAALPLEGSYACLDAACGLWCLAGVPAAATAGTWGLLAIAAPGCRPVSLPFRTTRWDLESPAVRATDADGQPLATLAALAGLESDFTAADRARLEAIAARLPAGLLTDAAAAAAACQAALAAYDAPTQAQLAAYDAPTQAQLAARTLAADQYARAALQQSLSPEERHAVADAVLSRGVEHVEAVAAPYSLCYSVLLASAADRLAHPGFVTVYRTDGQTEFCRKAITAVPGLAAVARVAAGGP